MSNFYNPSQNEERWVSQWEKDIPIHDSKSKGKPFSIVIPPPNVTGSLHIGHSLSYTLQDVFTRWARLKGCSTRWIPGSDHAGIATQAVLEKKLESEGSSKIELGKEAFLKRAWEWKDECRDVIFQQFKRLGITPYWPGERFTMDEQCNKAVKKAFVELYKKDVIFKGNRLVNWDCQLQTAVSDIEVDREDRNGFIWTLEYKTNDGKSIKIATTRPETIFADSAIAVNPNDERFKSYLNNGVSAFIPLIDVEIPIVADDSVDMDFGEGALKVTPAHDHLDFEIGERHDLPIVTILGKDGKLSSHKRVPNELHGLNVAAARRKAVEMLENSGSLVDAKKHKSAIGISQRSGSVIEPMLSEQWFLNMKVFKGRALELLKDGSPSFYPERWGGVYGDWWSKVENWCISRQLWWGHQIPAWYPKGDKSKDPIVSENIEEECLSKNHDSKQFIQDEDVLDTWFSSALWPLECFGWPEEDPKENGFFPTSLLVTGYDIIFFWVLKMVLMSLAFEDKTPFKEVLIHGLVCDKKGRKMSKSKGNTIDPLEAMDEYGADSLRFALLFNMVPAEVIPFGNDQLVSGQRFMNKIWNAANYINSLEPKNSDFVFSDRSDHWIAQKFNETVASVDKSLEGKDVRKAMQSIHHFFWNEFCDWYLEIAKSRSNNGDLQVASNAKAIMEKFLVISSPFVPFICEDINLLINNDESLVATESWPSELEGIDMKESEDFQDIYDSVKSYRKSISILGLSIEEIKEVVVDGSWNHGQEDAFLNILRLKKSGTQNGFPIEMAIGKVMIPNIDSSVLSERVDELKRNAEDAGPRIKRLEGQLQNKGFISNAPKDKVQLIRDRLKEAQKERDELIKRSDWISENLKN